MTDDELTALVLAALAVTPPSLIAQRIGCSVPSVERWRRGLNLPHPAVRPRIAAELRRML